MGVARSRSVGPVIGLDIGAIKVAAGEVDETGRVTGHSGTLLHGRTGPDGVLAASIRAISRSRRDSRQPSLIGIGVAAQVDPATGMAWFAPNLRWRDVDIASAIQARFGCPVRVFNDARSAAFAEWRFGAGVGERDLLSVTVGTGVGGGVVLGGRLLGGAANACGEIGHTVLVSGGRRCHCPGRGCFEAYVGGWAIAERAQEAIRKDPGAGRRLVEIAGAADRIDARAVGAAAADGDRLSEAIVRTTSNYLSNGVAGLVNAFNPARVVLGGGVIEGWPHLVDAVGRHASITCQPPAARSVRVSRSQLGREAVIVGAAALAREASPARAMRARAGRGTDGEETSR